ncbi:hypothetical protein [Faecalibaculum rodentium]|uniref:hypothetical protein n=1 Tax=Faecalibaculum rodentium TaxID=1702221 RepID=UPI002624CB3A|nr:hypothetical protein [Faecalibaculum rodentium]
MRKRDTFTKRFLGAALGAVLLFAAGCSNSEADAAKTTVESFLKTQQEGDMDASKTYLAGESADMFDTREDMRNGLRSYEEAGVNSKTLDEFVDAQTRACSMMWEKYEVGDVKVEGDKATVLVNTTGIDMDDWDNLTESGLAGEVGSRWMDDHASEIDAYKSSHTEAEFQAWYLDRVVPEYAQELLTRLDAMERKTTDYRMTLVKDGDDWKVTDVEVGTNE